MSLPTRKDHTLKVYQDVAPNTSYKPVTGTAQEVLSRRRNFDSLDDDRIDQLVERELQGVSRRHNRKRVVLSEGMVSSLRKELDDFLFIVEYDFKIGMPVIEIPGEPEGYIVNTRYKNGEIVISLLKPVQRMAILDSLRDVNHEYLRKAYIWPGDFKPTRIRTIPV